jgi:adenylosuccinate lyase
VDQLWENQLFEVLEGLLRANVLPILILLAESHERQMLDWEVEGSPKVVLHREEIVLGGYVFNFDDLAVNETRDQ